MHVGALRVIQQSHYREDINDILSGPKARDPLSATLQGLQGG